MKLTAREPKTGARYTEFASKMRLRIESRALEPGERLPSFQMARRRHGLSQSSVERAYALLEEEGLIERRPYSGFYVTDPQKRARTGVIAVSENFPSDHDYYLRLLRGVKDAAYARQTEVLLLHGESRVSWDKVDGVLSCAPYSETFLQGLPPGMPHVALLHAAGEAPCVAADDYNGVREAVRHLVQYGHKRIAYLTVAHVDSAQGVERQRLAGYHAGLEEAGIVPNPRWRYPTELYNQPVIDCQKFGYQQMQQWLRDDWDALGCTAVLAQNDETAIGILDALQESGCRVPEEISVIGFDGLELSHPSCGRLTSVRVPLYEIGLRGTEFLLERIQQPLSHNQQIIGDSPIILPTELQIGNSVGKAKT